MNNVASIISELVPKIEVEKIIDITRKENAKIYLRRLGYILESVINDNKMRMSNDIYNGVGQIKYNGLLDPSLPKKGSKYNKKWGLYINRDIELDEI